MKQQLNEIFWKETVKLAANLQNIIVSSVLYMRTFQGLLLGKDSNNDKILIFSCLPSIRLDVNTLGSESWMTKRT